MPKEVGCSVDSCAYNKDCKCDASRIEVDNCNFCNAKTSVETACKTFKPK